MTARLEHWSRKQPGKHLFTFYDVDGQTRESYTYASFLQRTQRLAEHLARQHAAQKRDRVLLVYPPGLEIVAAFFACARLGWIAVPVVPPTPMSFESGIAKLIMVARDCGARVALTTRGFHRFYRLELAKRRLKGLFQQASEPPRLDWLTTDLDRVLGSTRLSEDANDVLFLQYTSGSTSDPKGVVVSHRNVLANAGATLDHRPTGVSWLPQYHDMGFIGYYLYSVLHGGECYGFSPLDFLERPRLWLELVTRVRATITSAPNFAYEYCLRRDKLADELLDDLDLSSLRIVMNAAEPVRPRTFRRFRDRFARCGLRPEAYMVAYGLAENTLAVSLHGKQIVTVNKRLLQQRRLHFEEPRAGNNNQTQLVSCGKPLHGIEVRIVDPEARGTLAEDQIGEIWIAGDSKARGYWNQTELSQQMFEAELADNGEGSYLRTGDLGFLHDGELFVCGRLKDLIILRGVNYYPQDIEAIVEGCSPRIRKGCCAAFAISGDDGEALAVVAEVRDPAALPDATEIARAIRIRYFVEPRQIAFLPKRTIPKTTSGKIARHRVREAWQRRELPILASYGRGEGQSRRLHGRRQRFRYLFDLYDLDGSEQITFDEIGIDSLTTVTLIEDLKDVLAEHGAGGLIDSVDVRLLQQLTVAGLFDLVDDLERGSSKPPEAWAELLQTSRRELEARETQWMRSAAQLALPEMPPVHSPGAEAHVLVTGVTGFFGPFLLKSLLARTRHVFTALIRATDPVHARDRLRTALQRIDLWNPELERVVDTRVKVVCGDLTRSRLGCTETEWKSLSEEVDAICHNGAAVDYVRSYRALEPHNVDGTRELLRLAAIGRRKSFHLVSSTTIFGWSAKELLLESDHNVEMAHLDFGYAQSKWVAEQLALTAEKQGLDVRIYRPSFISASTDGAGSRDDIAMRLLAFMIRHGIAVDAHNQVSFLPADVVADSVAAIFGQPFVAGTALHVTADEVYNLVDVTRMMTRLYGFRFRYYAIPEFVDELNRRCTRDDPLYPLLGFFNRCGDKIAAMERKRYDNRRYRQARTAAGDVAPDPSLEAVVSQMVRSMQREGLLDRSNPAVRQRETIGTR